MFSSEAWLSNSSDFFNGVATQSLRFDDGSSAYLTFTTASASSATDRRKVTHSVWVKRGVLGADQTIYSSNRTSGGDYYLLRFSSDNKLTLILDVDANSFGYDTSAVFRDVGAWYHVCVIIDTTQATDTDRVKIYVNGVLQDKTIKYTNHVSQNFSTYVMDGSEDEIGRFAFTDASYFDGYMSEFITTIGQDNTISEFGELKNGVWIPIDYAGSYGGNGFRLQFNQTGTGTASSSTIGADTSGNDHHFTSSGIVASDCDMPDSPENNFCTLNPLRHNISGSESDGNLRYVNTATSSEHRNYGTFGLTSGKFYWEGRCEGTNPDAQIGLGGVSETLTSNTYRISYKSSNGATVGLSGATYSTFGNGDIIGVAYDADNTQITFYKNNTAQTGSPVSITADTQGMFPMLITYNEGSTSNSGWIMNFGQDSSFVGNETAQGNTDGNGIGDFYYTPPSGYLALCTANLPEPTISPNADTQADDYFNTILYTGTYAPISITGVGFQPDWVWIKKRNGSAEHILTDSLRGAGKFLASQTTTAERTSSSQITSFDSDGFSMSSGDSGTVNGNGDTYVSWNWKAGGTAVSNTDGTITSSISANTDAGFSIVSYTGTGSGATVGHGVGKELDFIIIKRRSDSSAWAVYSRELGSGKKLELNGTSGTITNAQFFTANPTSSVFSLGTEYDVNGSGGTFVAYCFAEIEGYSKFGSYTGNGSTDGTFVYLGFRPAWVMLKRTDSANNWHMNDSVRDIDNTVIEYLYADSSAVEDNLSGGGGLDFLSNGFKIRSTTAGVVNASGGTYIYMAFAEVPFKYSTGR